MPGVFLMRLVSALAAVGVPSFFSIKEPGWRTAVKLLIYLYCNIWVALLFISFTLLARAKVPTVAVITKGRYHG